jgi:hypothetical protein
MTFTLAQKTPSTSRETAGSILADLRLARSTVMRRFPSSSVQLVALGVVLLSSGWSNSSAAAPPTDVPPPTTEDARDPAEPPPAELDEPPPAELDEPPPAELDEPPPPADTPPTTEGASAPEPPAAAPAPVIEPAEPAAPPALEPELGGLLLRVEPGVAACLGQGCRAVQVGDASGSIGVGGSLAVHLAYRASDHLSLEVGGLAAVHGNDIESSPSSTWFLAQAGPRLHLSGGRWRAEPVVGLHVGYVRSLVRWSNAGSAADGLALGADVGVQLRLTPRVALAFLGSATLPYWTRVCDVDLGIRDCHGRSELTDDDLQRYFFVTSVAFIARLF